MQVSLFILSFFGRLKTLYSAIRSALAAEYNDGPAAFLLIMLILLGAIVCAIFLGIAGKMPAMLNAAIHILPTVILAIGNLRHRAPHRWPRGLITFGMFIAATVMLRAPLDFDNEQELVGQIGDPL